MVDIRPVSLIRLIQVEFQKFVHHTDVALRELFDSIDRNKNGVLDRQELKDAFARAGITVSSVTLDGFLRRMDLNNDGVISYAEWRSGIFYSYSMYSLRSIADQERRNFLLFLPLDNPTNLKTVLSYYTATGKLNPEGDVEISETLQGLGTQLPIPHRFLLATRSLLHSLFQVSAFGVPSGTLGFAAGAEASADLDLLALDSDIEMEWLAVPQAVAIWLSLRYYEQMLTENLPHLGYFLAGGVAGAVSRTATAPLDRLKVYLIAQIEVKDEAVRAGQKASPLRAISRGLHKLAIASKELWQAGGVRSLFAGVCLVDRSQERMLLTQNRQWSQRDQDHARVCHQVWGLRSEFPFAVHLRFGTNLPQASKRAFAQLEGHNDPKSIQPISQLLSGGIGGMVSQSFVYPIDTLKL